MARRPRFNGATATLAALVGGGIGLSVALFLRALILNTPAEVRPATFYWWFVLFSAAGALWGLATQTMKQLERIQGYNHGSLRPSDAERPGHEQTGSGGGPGRQQPEEPQDR